MMLTKLAFRNLFRNFKRTILSVLTVVVGVMGLIMAYGMVRGVEDTFIRVDIDTDFGHLRVMKKGYLKEEENMPLDILVQEPQKTVQAIQKKWPKATVFQRIIFTAELGDGVNTIRCRGIALPAEAAEKAYRFSQYARKKRKLVKGENSLYIGADLAKTFKKEVGDRLTLVVRTQAGSLNALDFTIRDVLSVGNMLVDSMSIYVSMETGRKLLQMPKGAVDVIARLPSRKDSVAAAAVAGSVSSKNFPRTWQHKAQEIIDLQQMRRKIFNIMIALILLVAAIGIANTLLMSGYERRGEIGLMMAQGMRSGWIMRMFAMEAGALGLFGSLVGAAIGSAGALYFKAYGFTIPAGTGYEEVTTMSVASTIYFSFSVDLVITAIIVGVVVSVLGSLWPAWRITRLEPRDVLAGS